VTDAADVADGPCTALALLLEPGPLVFGLSAAVEAVAEEGLSGGAALGADFAAGALAGKAALVATAGNAPA
jgi:hypothetical protein